ncbi:virulence factor [Salinicoccus hispanicus]|uniref:virulence factor n=1 Tax=Salinicoccus hispanicus TaxID=157225 RepID=UPI002ADE704B|nr:virulence factor [Salinicoccus hispanicus]
MLTFKNIPYQIKLNDGEEHRKQLPDRFMNAVESATLPEDNIILLRKWEDHGTRYGTPDEVFQEVAEELEALYGAERLDRLIEEAKSRSTPEPKRYYRWSVQDYESREDWKDRLWLLNHMETPTADDYELLELALSDDKMQVRREAVSLLAMIEEKKTLSYLKRALQDRSVPVRRTAGDAYSDLGYEEGLRDMYPLLGDRSPIVRWRAAMFVYEVGDASSLPHLKAHKDDPQYDVRLQMEMAIARIEQGEAALGSVWKQIQERKR